MPQARNDFLGVQALRAVAAFLVVAYHAVEQWTTHVPGYGTAEYWPNGSTGVDVFFVISGLVMTLSVRRHAERTWPAWGFARDRLIRIVPLYWIITTAKVIAVAALPALAVRTQLHPLYVLGSYALWPVHDADGVIRPVLPVGWTLCYEMMFYLLIATALLLRAPMTLICVPVLIAVSIVAVAMPAGGFANTIVLEFLFGIAIGRCVPRLRLLPPTPCFVVAIAAFVALLIVPVGSGLARPFTWGFLAACLVASVIALEMKLRPLLPKWLLAAGDASYATYLTHGFVVPAVYFLSIRSTSVDWAGLAVTLILSLIISGIAGQITHRFVEQPLLLRFRSRRRISTQPAPG